jgi:hypothetical protein
MDQMIGSFENSLRERSRSRSKSRLSLSHTLDHSPANDHEAPSLITSVEGELLGKNDEIS